MELLLANKASVNAKAIKGDTPLMQAAAAGHCGVVELLLSNKADINSKNNDGSTALHDAAIRGRKEAVEVLLANKANPNAKTAGGVTPLMMASNVGHKDVVELLLANKADINAKDDGGMTPLYAAVSAVGANKDVVEVLLASKADVNVKNNSGTTSLYYAVRMGRKDIVELLLAHQADVNAKNLDGLTPLHAAVGRGNEDVIRLLLANNADANAKNNSDTTPMLMAAGRPNKDVVALLLANKADINAKNYDGLTPLHAAASMGSKDVVELLLANNADVTAQDDDGATPLAYAARGHRNVAELLLANKADVNARDDFDFTPLMAAANGGHKDVVELLLANKADFNAKPGDGTDGKTAFQSAKEKGYNDVAELLRQHGANKVLAEIAPPTPRVTRERLLVFVHASIGANDPNDSLKPSPIKLSLPLPDGTTQKLEVSCWDFIGDTNIQFGFYGPDISPSASPQDLKRLKLANVNDTLSLALTNIKRLFGEPSSRAFDDGVTQLHCRGLLVTSYFLDREFWSRMLKTNPDGIIVGVPRKSGLYWASASDTKAVDSLKRRVAYLHASDEWGPTPPISSALFLFKNDKWSVFQAPLKANRGGPPASQKPSEIEPHTR